VKRIRALVGPRHLAWSPAERHSARP
jgi:hypothetical protein